MFHTDFLSTFHLIQRAPPPVPTRRRRSRSNTLRGRERHRSHTCGCTQGEKACKGTGEGLACEGDVLCCGEGPTSLNGGI